jgi:hypothetical protein
MIQGIERSLATAVNGRAALCVIVALMGACTNQHLVGWSGDLDSGGPPSDDLGLCAARPDLGGNAVPVGRFENGLVSAMTARATYSASADSCFGTASLRLCADAALELQPSVYFSIGAGDVMVGKTYRGSAWVKVTDPRLSAIVRLELNGSVISQSFAGTAMSDWQLLSAVAVPSAAQALTVAVTFSATGGLQVTDCIEVDQLWLGRG